MFNREIAAFWIKRIATIGASARCHASGVTALPVETPSTRQHATVCP
jgi:hypothetical protein